MSGGWNDKESMVFLNTEIKSRFLCLPYTKQRKKFLTGKELFMDKVGGIKQKKRKESFLTDIKKDPTTTIKKHAN